MSKFISKAFCPLCEQGSLIFKSSNEIIYLMCEECDSVFLDAYSISVDKAIFPQSDNNWKIGKLDAYASYNYSHWATFDEIKEFGWEWLIDRELSK